jgi:chitin disaccharide deacetylase
MVGGAAAADAIRRARGLSTLAVGLHLVLVEGTPTLPPERIPALVDGNGRLRRDLPRLGAEIACRPASRRQLRSEINAQFEAFRRTGLKLDHVNAHKHFHLHPVVAREIIAIGSRFGMAALRVPAEPRRVLVRVEKGAKAAFPLLVPWLALLRRQARRAGLLTPDAVFGLAWSGAFTRERMIGLLGVLPPGVVEIYTHPAAANRFQGHAERYRYTEERDALTAPESRIALQNSGFRLGSYADAFGEEPAVNHSRGRDAVFDGR